MKKIIEESIKKFNILEIISMIVLIVMFITVGDRELIYGIPFLFVILFSMVKNKEKREIIFRNIGLVGVVLFLLGFSFSDHSGNRGNCLMILSFIIKIFYYKDRKIEFGEKKIMYLFFMILFLGILWTSFSYDGTHSIGRFIKVNKRFLDIFLMLNIIKSRREFKIVEGTFLFGAVVLAAYYIYDYFSKIATVSTRVGYRCEGFKNVAYSTGLLMIAFLYLFGIIWEIKSIKEAKEKYYYYILLFIISYGLILTKLRAGFLGAIGGVILIIILRFKAKKIFMLLIFACCLLFITPKSVIERTRHITIFKTMDNINKASDNLRRVMWQGSIYTWKNNKIFGAGARGTKYWIQKYADENTDEKGYLAPGVTREMFTFGEAHSIYLNMLAETGIFSILYFVQLFIFIPSFVLRILKNKKDIGRKIGAAAGIAGFYIFGVVWSIWGYFGMVQSIFQFMLFIMMYLWKEDSEV